MEKPASQSTASKPVTTFVQTDSNTFREVVQRLTGPSETGTVHGAAAVKVAGTKRPTSKLHERRHCTRPKLEIVKPPFPFKPGNQCFSPSKSGNSSLQPSPVGTPSTMLSKLSIFQEDNNGESAITQPNSQEEERAIKEKRFYLHPSPRSRPGYNEPELITLFPLTSPKTSEKL